MYVSIPYYPGLGDQLKKLFSVGSVSVALKPTNSITSQFNHKNKLDMKTRTGVVYMIECMGDGVLPCYGIYMDQTKRHESERIREHELSVSKTVNSLNVSSPTLTDTAAFKADRAWRPFPHRSHHHP